MGKYYPAWELKIKVRTEHCEQFIVTVIIHCQNLFSWMIRKNKMDNMFKNGHFHIW